MTDTFPLVLCLVLVMIVSLFLAATLQAFNKRVRKGFKRIDILDNTLKGIRGWAEEIYSLLQRWTEPKTFHASLTIVGYADTYLGAQKRKIVLGRSLAFRPFADTVETEIETQLAVKDCYLICSPGIAVTEATIGNGHQIANVGEVAVTELHGFDLSPGIRMRLTVRRLGEL